MDRGRPPRPGGSDSGTVDRYDEPGLRPAPFDQAGVVSRLFNFRAVHHPARAVCPLGGDSGRGV